MLKEYFWNRVIKRGGRGCWEWSGTLNNKGYGMAYIRGVGRMTAHRASYVHHFGELKANEWVLHKCDNPKCVRPSHLFKGSPKDNVEDMFKKGRENLTGRPKGEKNPNAKLTESDVIAIRQAYVDGLSRPDIAKRFGISLYSVSDYTTGDSWRHVVGGPTQEEMEAAKRKTPGAKINRDAAIEIRRRLAKGELGKDLALEFGIHKATVSDIRRGKIWA